MLYTLHHGNCLDIMPTLDAGSVDLVLTDPPYGTTACKWDTCIPFGTMWEQLKRITKKNGAIVLFGSQPFTSALVMSNPKMFKYEWVWEKSRITGFVNAKNQPLRQVEYCLVFSQASPTYYPQGLERIDKVRKNTISVGGEALRKDIEKSSGKGSLRTAGSEYIQEFTNYPKQILKNIKEEKKLHPTQKPVALLEYLIKTYTNEGETVLDFTFGSGSTGVACANTGRKFIGIEMDEDYFNIAQKRIEEAKKYIDNATLTCSIK